jgi:hypothetical protein
MLDLLKSVLNPIYGEVPATLTRFRARYDEGRGISSNETPAMKRVGDRSNGRS